MAKTPPLETNINAVTVMFGAQDTKDEKSSQQEIQTAIETAITELGLQLVMLRVEVKPVKVKAEPHGTR